VYFLNDKGVMNVVRPGPRFEQEAQSKLGEKCFASPAISHGQLIIRGEKHLYCFDRQWRTVTRGNVSIIVLASLNR
jgi:outer membrane protein assembly factor BamB